MHQQAPTILIIDDNPENDLLFHALKEETQYAIVIATNGPEALRIVDQIKPDLLILSDARINSLELYDSLRMQKRLEEVSVLMITDTIPEGELLRRGILHIEKPVDLTNFLLTVEALVTVSKMSGERRNMSLHSRPRT
ncbi:MAG TPA: response regulator [Ktedonobacteraceae bacterium]|nr:response regulator [Ktedonobacteraceae bacterium]